MMQVKSLVEQERDGGGALDAIQQLGAFVSPSKFHWTSGKMWQVLAKTFF